jgi:hypothetical protein
VYDQADPHIPDSVVRHSWRFPGGFVATAIILGLCGLALAFIYSGLEGMRHSARHGYRAEDALLIVAATAIVAAGALFIRSGVRAWRVPHSHPAVGLIRGTAVAMHILGAACAVVPLWWIGEMVFFVWIVT